MSHRYQLRSTPQSHDQAPPTCDVAGANSIEHLLIPALLSGLNRKYEFWCLRGWGRGRVTLLSEGVGTVTS